MMRTSKSLRPRPAWRCVLCGLYLCFISALAHAAWPPSIPSQLWLDVRNESPYARNSALVSASVPLPRSLNLRNINSLRIRNATGQLVPASYRILARWHADRSSDSAAIQWLLVRFPATVGAQSNQRFRLQLDAPLSTPVPRLPIPLTVSMNASEWRIETGTANFSINPNTGRLLQAGLSESGLSLGHSLLQGSQIDARIAGIDGTPSFTRRIRWEHRDELIAILLVDYQFNHAPAGGGAITGGARWQFEAGSSAVSVREWIDWEGSRCGLGTLSCSGLPDARQLQRWQATFELNAPTTPATLQYQAELSDQPSLVHPVSADFLIQQLRRTNRLQPPSFEVRIGAGLLRRGMRADAPLLLFQHAEGKAAISLDNMANYEPQALRFQAASNNAPAQLNVRMANDAVWLGQRQGAYTNYRLGVYPSSADFESIRASQLGGLQTPLIGLPEAAWIAASEAVDELPEQPLSTNTMARTQALDSALARVLQNTQELRQSLGLAGLQTFGLFPRNWGDPVLSDEIDCGNDPTPAFAWDNTYWCATWTDYHNASAISNVAAWRLRRPLYLHQISTPAALRSLHTHMLRCDDDDTYSYCGQFPTGYGGYRADFNSSHQYIENLLHYYWRTGDETVPERLVQGAANYRAYLCPTRVEVNGVLGPTCAASVPIGDPFAGVNDRVANQFYEIFHFLGSTVDASFLSDWQSNSARALTQNLAFVRNPNVLPLVQFMALISPSGQGGTQVITGPGRYPSTQLWMAALYDWNQLYRWQISSADQPLGIPALTPSTLIQAQGYTLLLTARTPPGDGTANGIWPNTINFAFSGSRTGGSLSELSPSWVPGAIPSPCLDDCLYDVGKAALTASVQRAADASSDPALRALANSLIDRTLTQWQTSPLPLGKASGEVFARLSSAIARNEGSATIFQNGFEGN